jgi:hypothetical protein
MPNETPKPGATFEIVEVLAGAYRGRDIGERTLLTHVIVDGAEKSLCRKLDAGRLCDQAIDAPLPTCPVCAKRLPRLLASGVVRAPKS